MFNPNLTEQVSQSAERAVQATERVANGALESLSRASDTSVNFIKHEPIKSVLIAAATGAALMALIGLLNRPHARS
jgi:ElaB/YqjD/DUF883 family membrane-anchored ribosome-binding protein